MDRGEDGVSSPLPRSISVVPFADHLHDSLALPSSLAHRPPIHATSLSTHRADQGATGLGRAVPADLGGSRPSEPGSMAPGNGTFLTGGEDQTSPPFASSSQHRLLRPCPPWGCLKHRSSYC
ncbi:unnamed protein product [Urochloa humidicola]